MALPYISLCMKIELIKDKPYRRFSGWWSKEVLDTRYWFKRDGKLHFIHTLRQDTGSKFDDSRMRKEMAGFLRQLRKNKFRYLCHHARTNDIYEFINFIKSNGYSLAMIGKDAISYSEEHGMYQFSGNLAEYSAAFQYSIYDEAMVDEIRDLIKDIPVNYGYYR